jgi:hypothetical protein
MEQGLDLRVGMGPAGLVRSARPGTKQEHFLHCNPFEQVPAAAGGPALEALVDPPSLGGWRGRGRRIAVPSSSLFIPGMAAGVQGACRRPRVNRRRIGARKAMASR